MSSSSPPPLSKKQTDHIAKPYSDSTSNILSSSPSSNTNTSSSPTILTSLPSTTLSLSTSTANSLNNIQSNMSTIAQSAQSTSICSTTDNNNSSTTDNNNSSNSNINSLCTSSPNNSSPISFIYSSTTSTPPSNNDCMTSSSSSPHAPTNSSSSRSFAHSLRGPLLDKECAIVLEHSNFKVLDYIKAIEGFTSSPNIVMVHKFQSKVRIFLKSPDIAKKLCQFKSILINGVWVKIRPLLIPYQKVIIQGAKPWIPNLFLENLLKEYNIPVNFIQFEKIGYGDRKYSHIFSETRFTFLTSEDQSLPSHIDFTFNNEPCRIFLHLDNSVSSHQTKPPLSGVVNPTPPRNTFSHPPIPFSPTPPPHSLPIPNNPHLPPQLSHLSYQDLSSQISPPASNSPPSPSIPTDLTLPPPSLSQHPIPSSPSSSCTSPVLSSLSPPNPFPPLLPKPQTSLPPLSQTHLPHKPLSPLSPKPQTPPCKPKSPLPPNSKASSAKSPSLPPISPSSDTEPVSHDEAPFIDVKTRRSGRIKEKIKNPKDSNVHVTIHEER